MRSYTANFLAAIALSHGADLRLLLEISASTTLYYSDQSITVGAQAYLPQVLKFGRIQSGKINITLANIPRIDDKIKAGQTITLYMWDANSTASDKGEIFVGIIGEGITGNEYQLRFTCTTKGDFFDKKIGTKFDDATYPTADPDVYGKMVPIIIGSNRNVECYPIESGMVTTLRTDINDSFTTDMEITEHSRGGLTFPTSGGAASTRTVIIGDEEIIYTTCEKDNTPRFVTLTRGANGTTATSHNVGDTVIQKVSQLKYKIASHDLKAVTKPRILPFNSSDDETVQIDAADYSVDLPNAELTLTNIVGIRRQVNLAVTQQPDQPITTQPDQPITTQPDFDVNPSAHKHTTSAEVVKNLYGTSASGWTNSANCIDGNENTDADYSTAGGSETSNGLDIQFDTDNLGTLQNAFFHIKMSAAGFEADWIRVKADLNFPDSTQEIEIDPSGTPEWFRLNFTDVDEWDELDNVIVQFRSPVAGSSTVNVWEAYWEIHYIPTMSNKALGADISADVVSNRTTDAESLRTTDAAIGGDSVSDTLGGTLIVNVDGKPDDGSGTFTGVADALIEEPWHVFHWLIVTYSNGATVSDIDLTGSYQDAEDNLPSSGIDYKFARWITRRQMLNDLLTDLAPQAFCRHEWSLLGVSELIRLKNSGTAIRTINTNTAILSGRIGQDNRREQVQFIKPTLKDIANDIEIQYYHNPNLGTIENGDAYEGTLEDTNPNSIVDFGNRQRTWKMSAIGNNDAMGQDILDNYLLYYARGHQGISFPVDMSQLELEPGDLIAIRSTGIGILTELHDIIKIDYDLISLKNKKHLIMWINALNINLQTLITVAGACVATGVNPIVLISDVLFTPSPGAAIATGVEPTVLLIGSATISPSPGAAIATGINPAVILDSMAVTPSPGAAISSGVNPTVFVGIVVTASPGAAIATGIEPTVIKGALVVLPVAGAAITTGVDPTVVITQLEFYDTFEESGDTELSLHPPNIGDGWSELISDSGIELNVKGATNVLEGTAGSNVGALYETDNTISHPDYEVSLGDTRALGIGIPAIIALRIQDANNMYAVRFDRITAQIYKRVGGSWSTLGASFLSPSSGQIITLKALGTTISVLIDGVVKRSVTDSSHSSAGKAGVGLGAVVISTDDIVGQFLDTLKVIRTNYGSIAITPSPGAAIATGVEPAVAAEEDLTTYTEVDPNSRITVTAPKSTFAFLKTDETAYVNEDFGVDNFGNFEIRANIKATYHDQESFSLMLGLSNTLDDTFGWGDGVKVEFTRNVSNEIILTLEEIGGSFDEYEAALSTDYYVTFKRVGTTITLEIYSDAARTTLLDTLSIIGATTEYRYFYVTSSSNRGTLKQSSGYTQDVSIISP
jgi:hypothetical protein